MKNWLQARLMQQKKAAAMSMQQDFCCVVQTCLIGLMHVCVSIIVAAKLLHRADARVCVSISVAANLLHL